MMHLVYDHYYRHGELVAALESMVKQHEHIAALSVIGKSYENRDIVLVTLTNRSTGPDRDKPALYIDGNHHAGECVGTMVSLYAIDYLLSNYGKCQTVTGLLDRAAVYVIPMVSPDGTEVFLTTPESLRSAPRLYPFAE